VTVITFLLSRYILKLLLLRGETNIRILDIVPPSQDVLDNPAVSYVQMDMTSRTSVDKGLLAPFPLTGAPPSVIFHCAASIRFWERASYTWSASYHVNVAGTQHLLDSARSMARKPIFIYTSTSDIILPRPHFMHINGDYNDWPYNTVVVSDEDRPLSSTAQSPGCYSRSKILGETLVLNANGDEMVTASLRPGQ
jgi:nucleoside-diphosphate-sugar epimerase